MKVNAPLGVTKVITYGNKKDNNKEGCATAEP